MCVHACNIQLLFFFPKLIRRRTSKSGDAQVEEGVERASERRQQMSGHHHQARGPHRGLNNNEIAITKREVQDKLHRRYMNAVNAKKKKQFVFEMDPYHDKSPSND